MHRNLSYAWMVTYLSVRYGVESQEVKEALKSKALSKSKDVSCVFAKTYFLNKVS